ncbi:hypothetical protein [Comamonas sp. JC664]|uniref:hypothetical protein n=1 Tax=Comamonas sp. JC664 TaxID=2801917 RepID=UPI003623ACA3
MGAAWQHRSLCCGPASGLRLSSFFWASLGIAAIACFSTPACRWRCGRGHSRCHWQQPHLGGLLQPWCCARPCRRCGGWAPWVSVAGGGGMVMGEGGSSQVSWPGLALCLLAGLSYAGYAWSTSAWSAICPQGGELLVFSGAALLALPWPHCMRHAAVEPVCRAVVVYLGAVVSGIAHLLFSMGLRHISGPTGVALSPHRAGGGLCAGRVDRRRTPARVAWVGRPPPCCWGYGWS